MPRSVSRWALVLLTIIAFPQLVHTQCTVPSFAGHPDKWVVLEDGIPMCRVACNGIERPDSWFSSSIEFSMLYDSTNVVNYRFADCKLNGARLPFNDWKRARRINANADVLGFNSRTVEFLLTAGDTISFFRDLIWHDPILNKQTVNGYHAADTLTYAVELINSVDSQRVALLDSLGVMPCPTACIPVVFGTRPVLALVKYVVPTSLHGIRAFVRLRPRARGTGEYFFTRSESPTVGYSEKLNNPMWIEYLQSWSQLLVKPSTGTSPATANGTLRVATVQDAAVITFASSPDARSTAIAVFDVSGNAMFYPYSSPGAVEDGAVHYRFPQNGVYFVCLITDGHIIATEKVSITK